MTFMGWRTRAGVGVPAPPGGVTPNLWLDPTDDSFMTKNGSNCAEIRDKSGLGRDYDQTTAANQPLVKAVGINSKQTLEYEATTEEWLNAKADHFASETAAHMYLVLKLASDTPAGGENALLTWGSSAAGDVYHVSDLYFLGVASDTRYTAGTHDEDLTADHVFEVRSAPAGNWDFDFSGVNQFSLGGNVVAFAATTQIGVDEAGTNHLDGEHGWLLQYDHVLDAGDRTSVEGAINTEWGVTFS